MLSEPRGLETPALKPARTDKSPLSERAGLMRELMLVNQDQIAENEVFLIVVNAANTTQFDEIVRIFGYQFVDDIFSTRLHSLGFLTSQLTLYSVGFWSFGFIYRAAGLRKTLLTNELDTKPHENFLAKLRAQLAEPIMCHGIPIPIKAGIGVCDLKKARGASEDMLQNTFIAGKQNGQSLDGWTFCNYELAADHRRAFSIIADVGHSLTMTNEFELFYQPRLDLRSGQYSCAEALLRWRHPDLGVVSPGEFIPLVEMTGLIRDLTHWVLSQAIAQTTVWHRANIKLKIAVNISVKNLEEDDFVQRLTALLTHYRLDPHFLELEFSENREFFDLEKAKTNIAALQAAGVKIAIDDVGTGQNSLLYLEATPANILKIDHNLVASLNDKPRHHVIVQTMIAMAHEIGMKVVAEGVESRQILDLLALWGSDSAQGYYLSRPLYADQFENWYLQNQRHGLQ